jgi:CRISPR-associated protein Csb1
MIDWFSLLSNAVQKASALRIILRLKPAMSDGLVYPPTYDQGQHIFRPAWVNGEKRQAVLLDSVQSQANRIEMAILAAHQRGDLHYPDIQIEVKTDLGDEHYSVLELSHRIYDAALRMCKLSDVLFPLSDLGKAVYQARADRASALFTHAPITLILGGWDSHGGGGPLVAKLPRLLTSEIVGLDAERVQRGAVKFDPMDIRKDAGPIYTSADPQRVYEVDAAKAADPKKDKGKRPSEVGLGNVPKLGERGAVITEALQTSLISCVAVRRLRFENQEGSFSAARDQAGQTATAALGLYGLLAQMEAGYNLRSGCDLLPLAEPQIEVIGRSLEDVASYPVTAAMAKEALLQALEASARHGLTWRSEPVTAKADERLVTLIERSRRSRSSGDE